MEETKQLIKGGLLSDLAKLLFGKLDKVLTDEAKYEKELGVLKAIEDWGIQNKDTGEKHILTIKLAPVKDKEGVFYVEAYCKDLPDLKLPDINNKAIKLDTTTRDQFAELINKALSKQGYAITGTKPESTDTSEEDEKDSPENESDEEELSAEEEMIQKLISDINELLSKKKVFVKDSKGRAIQLVIDVERGYRSEAADVTITGVDGSNTNHVQIPAETLTARVIDNSGNVRILTEFYEQGILKCIDKYIAENSLNKGTLQIAGSTIIKASLIREKGTDDINLTAISASTNIKAAMDIIYDLSEDTDFIDQLPEGIEQSFEIVDDGDDYDIEQIESFDTSETYVEIFKEVCIADSILRTYRWAIGDREWNADTFFYSTQWPVVTLLDRCAVWVVDKTDKFPSVIGAFGNDVTHLEDVKIDGELSLDLIKEQIKLLLEGLSEVLDIYYVNVEHNEQKMIDDFLNDVQNILAYA